MKKLVLSIVFAFVIQYTVSPQSCLPEGITFNTQEEINNFKSNYPSCTEIEGFVNISGSDEITNLQGLDALTRIGGRLRFYSCSVLSSLTGLENITSIGGDLEVYLWPSTSSILTNLTGLDNLTSIGGALKIQNNDVLTSLTGLEKVTTIGGYLQIASNDVLNNLSGLANVTSIGEYIWIGENPALYNLIGLGNLATVGGDLEIYDSNLTSLTGLDNLATVDGSLRINYNEALINLSGLNNLITIAGIIEIYDNNVINSLTGLDNLEAGSITGLTIGLNPSLSTCEVKSVCDFLASPTGSVYIANNASGCNSTSEVSEACEALSVEVIYSQPSLSIYPNPAKNELSILGRDESTMIEVNIYNLLGQIIFNEKQKTNIIDISELKQGIYMIELISNDFKVIEKLIIE